MNLYDFLIQENADYDTYDNVFDSCVTVCTPYRGQHRESIDDFTDLITKNVSVIRTVNDTVICNWSDFIRANMPILTEVAKKHWESYSTDEDDFIFEWIEALHYWIAGYQTDEVYRDFVKKYAEVIVSA